MFARVENECRILTRHLAVLETIASNEPIGLVTLANRTRYPLSKVRYSVRVLEADGLVTANSCGIETTTAAAEWFSKHDTQIDAICDQLSNFRIKQAEYPTIVINGD